MNSTNECSVERVYRPRFCEFLKKAVHEDSRHNSDGRIQDGELRTVAEFGRSNFVSLGLVMIFTQIWVFHAIHRSCGLLLVNRVAWEENYLTSQWFWIIAHHVYLHNFKHTFVFVLNKLYYFVICDTVFKKKVCF